MCSTPYDNYLDFLSNICYNKAMFRLFCIQKSNFYDYIHVKSCVYCKRSHTPKRSSIIHASLNNAAILSSVE